ncbi:MAG: glycosyltransferase family 1 protein [Candidatus Afipia apatlaquensis]|uniref:Glycosyltransferase family 1 protein n=1 Tax=Candidatus Afipia apatlaquensis TaxID=2712852 RepID=A0A7C9VIU2_9BRAD|nr:glycosyltransferase family 1 protein [Candidatus Afipia apatlaquensis]
MKTVLFAWEHGGGFGHIANLGRFAALLKRPDVRVVFALKNPEAAYLLDANAEVLQAPPWPTAQSFRSTATMHDQLASAGLRDEHGLRSLLQSWDSILKAVSPDLVVADYAPAVSLMARGRIPLIVVGNGYTAPPGAMTRFPPLHRVHPPRLREEETLETVNRVLQSLARPPLERLPQMFSGNAQIVLTFPVLDPYDLQRSEALAGPIVDSPPLEARKDADDIFVYLSRAVLSALPFDLVSALLPVAERLVISAPDLASEHSENLSRRGARIFSQHLPLSETLASARLVIHFGGGGLAAHAIAAGVPQLVVATHIEQLLNGLQLEKAGLGKVIDSFVPQVDISKPLEAILTDDHIRQRAAQAGHEHRDMLKTMKPLETFEAAALRLLGNS